MANEYKKCPNGHYYEGDHCPYCKSSSAPRSSKTKINDTGDQDRYDSQKATESFNNNDNTDNTRATIVDEGTRGATSNAHSKNDNAPISMAGRTVFGPEEDEGDDERSANTGHKGARILRETRKFVGWLVSYTLDPLGVDFKIYEGRNIIGRDPECNITVNDNWVSLEHAVLLFRAGKFSITDRQSSHGTFVNDKDIDLEPYLLADGDNIKIGQTVFKFRTAL